MQKLILPSLLVSSLMGCTYIETSIIPPAGTGKVEIKIQSDRNVTTNPAIQGNVPLQGGTVSNPVQQVKP